MFYLSCRSKLVMVGCSNSVERFWNILNKTENRKFKIDAEMINLIGCNKEGFYSLMLSMNYKKGKETDTYFYSGEGKRKNKFVNINRDENPFKKLLALNIK